MPEARNGKSLLPHRVAIDLFREAGFRRRSLTELPSSARNPVQFSPSFHSEETRLGLPSASLTMFHAVRSEDRSAQIHRGCGEEVQKVFHVKTWGAPTPQKRLKPYLRSSSRAVLARAFGNFSPIATESWT
jgi:hypothetical protein